MSAAVQDAIHPRFEDAMKADIARVFAKQQDYALKLRISSAAERIAKLKRLRDVLRKHEQAIFEACYADFKKPHPEVEVAELLPVYHEIKHNIRHLKGWMKGHRIMPTLLMFGTKTRIHYEPKGVSLIIAPWNYPINLTLMPLVSAIAAGCTAVLKPSEMTPHCSAVIKTMIGEIFDEQEVATFEGDVTVSSALLDLPFDHIFFTGSPMVGKIVMEAAAKHLTSVTLELGGKSPAIVDETADIDKAAASLMFGKFANCGQTCIAPDYVYVHRSVKDKFLESCKARLVEAYGDNPATSADYARVVNHRHFGRVKDLLDDAVARGGRIVAGGQTIADDNFIAPTILTDIHDDAHLMHEEIFGPLCPVLEFDDLEEAITGINSRAKPLALYVYTRENKRARHVLDHTTAGGSCINQCVVQYLHMNAPFGGVNNSGIGNSHGYWGFKAFSHERTVIENKFSQSTIFAPPYTDFSKRLVRLIVNLFR